MKKLALTLIIIGIVVFSFHVRPNKRPSGMRMAVSVLTFGTFDGAIQLGRLIGLSAPEKDLDVRWLNHMNRAQRKRSKFRLKPAYRQLKRAMKVAKSFSGKDPRRKETLWKSAEVARELARYSEAEKYLQEYIRVQKLTKGNDLEVAKAMNMIASTRLQQAIHSRRGVGELIDKTEALLKKCTGSLHSERATIHHNRAMIHHYRKEFRKAQRLYLLALTMRQQTLGEDSPITAETYGDLGLLYAERGDRRGQPLVERAIAVYRNKFGDKHPWVGWYSAQLGYVNLRLGRVKEAKAKLRQAIRSRRPSMGKKHRLVKRAKCYLKFAKKLSKRK